MLPANLSMSSIVNVEEVRKSLLREEKLSQVAEARSPEKTPATSDDRQPSNNAVIETRSQQTAQKSPAKNTEVGKGLSTSTTGQKVKPSATPEKAAQRLAHGSTAAPSAFSLRASPQAPQHAGKVSSAQEVAAAANKGSFAYTVFDLITAPALITAPPDFLLYFHLLSPT